MSYGPGLFFIIVMVILGLLTAFVSFASGSAELGFFLLACSCALVGICVYIWKRKQ